MALELANRPTVLNSQQAELTHSQRRELRRQGVALGAEYNALFPSICNGPVGEEMTMGAIMKRLKANTAVEVQRLEAAVAPLRRVAEMRGLI